MSDEGSPSSSVHSKPSTIFIFPSRTRPSPVTVVLKIVLNILDVVVEVLEDVDAEVDVVAGDVTKGDVTGTVDGGIVGGTVVEAVVGVETAVESIVVGGCVVDIGGCVEGTVVVTTLSVFTVGTVVVRTLVGVVVGTVLVMGDVDVYVVELVLDVVLGVVIVYGDVGSPGLTPPTDSTVTTPITSSTTVNSRYSVVEDLVSIPADVSVAFVVSSTSLGVIEVT